MDLSNLVTTPASPPRKKYWEVLQDYREIVGDNPLLHSMTVPEFAERMNKATGTTDYEEGKGPNTFLRRLSGKIDIGLHHAFGEQPGGFAPPAGAKELFTALGVPK